MVLVENAISPTLIYFFSGHVFNTKNLLLLLLKLLLKLPYKNALNLKAAVFHLLSAFNRVEEFIKSSESNFQLWKYNLNKGKKSLWRWQKWEVIDTFCCQLESISHLGKNTFSRIGRERSSISRGETAGNQERGEKVNPFTSTKWSIFNISTHSMSTQGKN